MAGESLEVDTPRAPVGATKSHAITSYLLEGLPSADFLLLVNVLLEGTKFLSLPRDFEAVQRTLSELPERGSRRD
ncbi:hypothetical protein WJX84_002497 [Apatococcus fuscideae]|uniref:Uncharacterized protein n=1 Tax=Apatococcus fuscideae TaxID=2026836 RepID=A0AAW1TB24_9CHLO